MNTDLKNKLLSILLPHQPARVSVFGSYGRGEQCEKSDLDILVSFHDRISLLRLIQIEQELTDKLEIPVDLVTENSLKNARLKQYVLQDLQIIYE